MHVFEFVRYQFNKDLLRGNIINIWKAQKLIIASAIIFFSRKILGKSTFKTLITKKKLSLYG